MIRNLVSFRFTEFHDKINNIAIYSSIFNRETVSTTCD